jgi:hypothetical protein
MEVKYLTKKETGDASKHAIDVGMLPHILKLWN